MHVGVDQASVNVALGLDHHGVGFNGSAGTRLVAFVRQEQSFGRKRRFDAMRRYARRAFDSRSTRLDLFRAIDVREMGLGKQDVMHGVGV